MTEQCGCDVIESEYKGVEISFCPMHKAAPDLLAALEGITDCYFVGSTPEQFCFNVEDFMKQARAAIAKAKGK